MTFLKVCLYTSSIDANRNRVMRWNIQLSWVECPDTLYATNTHILTDWLARPLLRNLGFKANLTLADHSQMVWDFTVAAPRGGRFQALSYQFSSSTELLTSLAAEWYDVRLVVALVKQGSALLARGWVTARLISRWHLSGLVAVASNACEVTLWIDFHGRGLNET